MSFISLAMTYRDIVIDSDCNFDDFIDDASELTFDPSHYTYVFINGEPVQLGLVEIDD